MDKNRELAELLGLCWHEHHESWRYKKGMSRCWKCSSQEHNPDYSTDSGKVELLRLMMKREDWDEFCASVFGKRFYVKCLMSDVIKYYITDTTGRLAQAALEWLRKEGV
jgi:hypothetical protein